MKQRRIKLHAIASFV